MALTAAGADGELRTGGRVAADLGAWTFEGSSNGWIVEAAVLDADQYLMEYDSTKELRLNMQTRTWRFRDVVATLGGERIVITGSGRPETM